MPGAVQLLEQLSTLYPYVQLGIASSSSRASFDLKTNHLTETLCIIDKENIILGDDPRILAGRGKPSPDIYLAALSTANDRLKAAGHETLIKPEECLVFEDSLSGLEAGRRAGMRVVWCPHPEFVKYAKSEEANPSNLPFTSKEIVNYIKHNTTDIDGCLDMDDGKWIISVSSLEDIDLTKLGVLGSSIA
ncbi:hypothetical protein NM208_g971 [Fusarium decemcellulare]|uniref:Uncharacterized protein n=1 Tax=Fusarium decemcellulare TaxID=57161 RepID=A0ACC1SXU8_9HYPO|nr:hypothetical protein NM208_g971 [Fusarium decemcellulare]